MLTFNAVSGRHGVYGQSLEEILDCCNTLSGFR